MSNVGFINYIFLVKKSTINYTFGSPNNINQLLLYLKMELASEIIIVKTLVKVVSDQFINLLLNNY